MGSRACLEATYRGRPVVVANEGASLALPVIAFVVGVDWGSDYRDRHGYERWHRWHDWGYRPLPPGWRPQPRAGAP